MPTLEKQPPSHQSTIRRSQVVQRRRPNLPRESERDHKSSPKVRQAPTRQAASKRYSAKRPRTAPRGSVDVTSIRPVVAEMSATEAAAAETPATEAPSGLRSVARRQSAVRAFFTQFSFEKSFVLIGFVVSMTMMILYAIDLALAWPFKRASVLFDVTFMLGGLVMFWLSWDVAKDQLKGRYRKPAGRIS